MWGPALRNIGQAAARFAWRVVEVGAAKRSVLKAHNLASSRVKMTIEFSNG